MGVSAQEYKLQQQLAAAREELEKVKAESEGRRKALGEISWERRDMWVKVENLEGENKRLRSALEWYADENRWAVPELELVEKKKYCLAGKRHGYEIAREALASREQEGAGE